MDTQTVGWIGFALSMTGQYFIVKKHPIAFVFWNMSNLLWIMLAYCTGNNPQLLMFTMFFIVNLFSIRAWLKNTKVDYNITNYCFGVTWDDV